MLKGQVKCMSDSEFPELPDHGLKNSETIADSAGDQPTYLPGVAKGAMINLFGAFCRTMMLYAYTLLLARALSPGDLGHYFLVFTVINIIGLVAIVGLDFGVVRYVALYAGEGRYGLARKTLTASLFISVPIGIALAAVIIGLAPWLTGLLMEETDASVMAIRIFAISIPFWGAARLYNATTQGMHRMEYQVYSRDIGEQLSKFVFTAIALIAGLGLIGVVWANVASVVLAAGMSLVFYTIVLPRNKAASHAVASPVRQIFRYSLPLAFSNILGMLLLYIDMLLVGYLGSPEDVGYYGAALRLVMGSQAIMLAFATVFTPVISDLYNKRSFIELHELFKTVGRWIFTCSFPIFLVLFLLADPVMKVFGTDFTTGSGALMLLAFSQLVNACTGTAGLMVLMSGRSHMELINVGVALIINTIICLLLIPAHGVIGAAIANVAAAAVINLMRSVEVWVFMRMYVYSIKFIKPLLAGAAGAVLVLSVKYFTDMGSSFAMLVISASILLVTYIVVMIALGLDEQDHDILRMIRGRLSRAEVA
ncbi:MAG: oligosaccharide flippase family protein [Thermoleophilia bacterium]